MTAWMFRLRCPSCLLLAIGLLIASGGKSLEATEAAEGASLEAMNALVGVELFGKEPLWNMEPASVAERLNLKKESDATTLLSFRRYPKANELLFGSQPYAIALTGQEAKVNDLLIIFSNKGDYETVLASRQLARGGGRAPSVREMTRELQRVTKEEAQLLQSKLTEVLGPPAAARMGETAALRERVARWDWREHAILLSEQNGEYVSIRIVPTEMADAGGRAERITDAQLREALRGRVIRRDNGDVLVGDLPMVDQGPKGYCVPATWERYLRYVGIPADMYLLAMAGQTALGGGTYVADITNAATLLIRRKGRTIETVRFNSLASSRLEGYIDNGLPLMWSMYVTQPLDATISARQALRAKAANMEEWALELEPLRKAARRIKADSSQPHLCMIIGYNSKTRELATTDSWGPEFAERWWTVEEAEAVSGGSFFVIRW